MGLDAFLVPVNQLMSICHQSSWCPQTCHSSTSGTHHRKSIGQQEGNLSGAVLLEDTLNCDGHQAPDLEEELQKIFDLSTRFP